MTAPSSADSRLPLALGKLTKQPRRVITMINFRRAFGLALSVTALAHTVAQGQQITVTLLGTGCPPAVMNRFGPSTLVEAGDQKFVFDAGRGALQRLTAIGVRWQEVEGVFLTHLHSDHVVGFPDL